MGGILAALLIGAIAGWLAGKIMRGGGFGIIVNIILGVIGGFVGNYLIKGFVGTIGEGIIGSIITATLGAVIILFIAGLFKKK